MPRLNKGVSYIGIDPGKSGGIAWLDGDGPEVRPMPATETDLWQLMQRLLMYDDPVAIIEKVHSMPKQGVVSSFTFGKGYGCLVMALVAAGIPFETVRPQVWQRRLGISPKKISEDKPKFKKRLLGICQKMYPKMLLWTESKKNQLAVCDALLMATYLKRRMEGTL